MRNSLIKYLAGHEKDELALLQKLVLQQSSSFFKEGVDAVGEMITASLCDCQMQREVVAEQELGNHLLFRSPAYRSDRPSLLLIGHMDTVFPVDSPFNWYKEESDKVFGPGVIDMKGGLVAAIFAIKALDSCGLLEKIPLTLLCNADEEIGSPASSGLIRREAKKSVFALGFECGGLHGEVVTGRKGKAGYILEVSGKAGHAAFAGSDKASAILELAGKVIALEQLNDPIKKIVVNVGLIKGGIGPNTVADFATAEIDTRYLQLEDAKSTDERIALIASQCSVAGTHTELRRKGARLPMEQTRRNKELFQVINQEAEKLEMPCVEELRGGVSDANTISEAAVPVVDGMGPIGDCDHSDREYMVKDSLLARTTLAACTLVSGWDHFQDNVK